MNFLKNAFLVLLMIVPMGLFAQTVKLAHVNTQQLLEQMPEVTAANKQLDTLNQQYTNELKSLSDEYQKKVAAYSAIPASTSEAIKNSKLQEIQQMEDRIRTFQDQAQQDLQKKNEELFTPIQKKVKDAIQTVAKENGYSYVFDSSSGTMLYATPTDDITPLVKKKLGMKQ